MTTQVVIGIAGYAGVGKDTLAGYIARSINLGGSSASLRSFAAPIRAIAEDCGFNVQDRVAKEKRHYEYRSALLCSLSTALAGRLGATTPADQLDRLYGAVERALEALRVGRNTYDISPRQFMQILGTEGGRSVDQNFWVDRARADSWQCTDQYVLVTDVRFQNELAVLDYVILLSREGVGPASNHVSEALPGILADSEQRRELAVKLKRPLHVIRVYNDGTKDRLRERARSYVLGLLWNDRVLAGRGPGGTQSTEQRRA